MNTRTFSSFHVAGYAVRAGNSEIAKISHVWGKFMQADLASLLPNRIGHEVYTVYFDYENDHTGAYTFLLGVKVPSLTDLAPEISKLTFAIERLVQDNSSLRKTAAAVFGRFADQVRTLL